MLQITQAKQDGTLTICLTGELDHHAARAAIGQAEDLLVLHRTCARCGYDFVVRGTPPQPMRVFDAAGLPQVMIFERGE